MLSLKVLHNPIPGIAFGCNSILNSNFFYTMSMPWCVSQAGGLIDKLEKILKNCAALVRSPCIWLCQITDFCLRVVILLFLNEALSASVTVLVTRHSSDKMCSDESCDGSLALVTEVGFTAPAAQVVVPVFFEITLGTAGTPDHSLLGIGINLQPVLYGYCPLSAYNRKIKWVMNIKGIYHDWRFINITRAWKSPISLLYSPQISSTFYNKTIAVYSTGNTT